MAVAQFYAWESDGRPITPATPIREFVERMRVQFPRDRFGWFADEAHYQANIPQDHTPYSYDGWPVTNPYPYVFATDVMHHPSLGVDCFVLFNYWLSEAKAGRMPWLKYLIWQAKIYDVRYQWKAQSSVGHFDHAHLSARTDYQFAHLGAWSVVPVAAPLEVNMFLAQISGNPAIYISDGQTYRHLTQPSNLDALRAIGLKTITVGTKALLEDLCGQPWRAPTGSGGVSVAEVDARIAGTVLQPPA